jgi:Sulfotransferase family
MWRALSAHPLIVMGLEWFAGRQSELHPSMFSEEQFFAPVPGLDCGYDIRTHEDTIDYVPAARARYADAHYIGDKIPLLYEHLDSFAANFPGATVVWLVRDVFEIAASYKRRHDNGDAAWDRGSVAGAVADFNASLAALRDPPDGISIIVAHYDRMFREKTGATSLLFKLDRRLDADAAAFNQAMAEQRLRQRLNAAARAPNLDVSEQRYIAMHADLDGYHQLRAMHPEPANRLRFSKREAKSDRGAIA